MRRRGSVTSEEIETQLGILGTEIQFHFVWDTYAEEKKCTRMPLDNNLEQGTQWFNEGNR